ncbi:MAG: MFS transporter [Clostridia bacterium]|nr:MFS transporter [Clostridia bacterium]
MSESTVKKNLTGREKAAYGLGAVGKDMVYMLSASYVLYYFQDIMGVSAVAMGVILMAARIFDAFNDPIMGVITAKTKTKWGKFRPWLFIGTILNAVVLYVMFSAPPTLTAGGLVAYAAVFYILWGVTYTMMDIPYWSMIPAFTEGGKERENLTTLARSCAGVGSALITIITMKIVVMLGQGNEHAGFSKFALIIAVLFIAAETITCLAIKEKSTVEMKTASVGDMFNALVHNDQAMVIVLTIVLVNTSVYITSNLVIYFFKYDFGGATWYNAYTLFNMFGGAMQILSMIILFPLLRRKLNTIQIFYTGIGMAVLGYAALIVLAFATKMSNVFILFVPGFFIFAAVGLLTVLTTVFLANTVDYGEIKTNSREESVIFSMQTFVVKLASGVAALAASLTLAIFHIQKDSGEGAAQQVLQIAESSRVGLRLSMTIIPIVLLVIAALVFRKKYILTDAKIEELSAEIRARRALEGTAD